MASRRSKFDADSSAMMLDTICNVFGGVILMAIMVIMHTQAAVSRAPKANPEDADIVLSARRMHFNAQSLQRLIEELAAAAEDLDASYSTAVSPVRDILIQRRAAFRGALATAATQRQQTTDLTAQDEQTLVELTEAASLLEAENGPLAETVDRQRAALDLRPVDPRTIRLPLSHKSRTNLQVCYVVRGDRVYPAWLRQHCRVIPVSKTQREWIPVEGAGFVVEETGRNAAFVASLSRFAARRHYVTFFTCATDRSFQSVQTLRRLVAEKGYDFGYCLFEANEKLIITAGKPDVE
ncbi:MAG: hypothetical protein ACYS8X_00050 [Planctomycetota bacterium]|jgi:hypothetical protein